MRTCKTCKHWVVVIFPKWEGYGHCDKWHADYGLTKEDVAKNEVVVESDEGWGAIMGPDFGCVLHEELVIANLCVGLAIALLASND